jgi:hypothetical protein
MTVKILHRAQQVQENINHNKKPISFWAKTVICRQLHSKLKVSQLISFLLIPKFLSLKFEHLNYFALPLASFLAGGAAAAFEVEARGRLAAGETSPSEDCRLAALAARDSAADSFLTA